MAILFRIISNARLAASPARQRAFTGPDEQMQAFTPSRSAHTSICRVNLCHLRVGSKRSMRCCLPGYAFFAADMYRTIFTRVFQLKEAAKHFVGTHDFAHFAANRGKPEKSTIRTIYSVRIRQKAACITIDFYGDGFLYKMVRLIVGALVKCALGKMRTEDVVAQLESGQLGPARFAAPAEGLFLIRVRY